MVKKCQKQHQKTMSTYNVKQTTKKKKHKKTSSEKTSKTMSKNNIKKQHQNQLE